MINNFAEKLINFFTGPRKRIAWLSTALVCMTLAALVVFIVQKTRRPQQNVATERELVIEQELLIPDGPQEQGGYITSRETKERWDDAEIERWLTLPSQNELDDLKQANDKTVSDILEASP